MFLTEEEYLAHYGILRKSGRYPWGSGKTQSERNRTFLGTVEDLKSKGMSEAEIAKGFGLTTTQLRAAKTIARNEQKQTQIGMAQRLKEKGYSNGAIAKRMDLPGESSVRALLSANQADKAKVLTSTSDVLKKEVDEKGFIDVGTGVETHLGVSKEKLNASIAILREQGYVTHTVQVDQLGTVFKTSVKVLARPETTYADVKNNLDKIQLPGAWTQDAGRSYFNPKEFPPMSVDSTRIAVRYKEQGGDTADGVIYVRPGVDDLSLGGNTYAQVRIMVDGTHYLKGMALYKDDLPDGVDLMFNTNKSNTGRKLDAMKPLKKDIETGEVDKTLPFGSITRPLVKKNDKGQDVVSSAMNIVNDEADWEKWSKTVSSQLLSKQSPVLAKTQLNMTYEQKLNELDAISKLTNPEVKRALLEDFADAVDASAVHLKAAHFPRQKTHVILPVNSVKETEVYAPNYQNGERVVLVRFPHGGKFEIPELTVNNRNPEAKKLLGPQPPNAIGINAKVAQRLSGADFDGDTVLVIPNNNKKIQSSPPLEGLTNFDPVGSYPAYDGMPKMTERTKQVEMGKVSNLITDMTIKGASNDELARAVRHSMVVIDAEKHNLNYKQSAIDNGISQLKEKYQGGATKGAATLISSKKHETEVPERKQSFVIDKNTGAKVFRETGATTIDRKTGEVRLRTSKASKILETTDVNTLSSGTVIEKVYADHSNKLKALANQARLEAVHTKSSTYSSSAKAAFAPEVASLNAKLNLALKNAPLERQAQLVGNAIVSQKTAANPDMEYAELKKIRAKALETARIRTGAGKDRIEITPSEWDAIQAGAISSTKLKAILDNADKEKVKELATPRSLELMTSTKTMRAKAMLAQGYPQADVAKALGVSLSTLKRSVNE